MQFATAWQRSKTLVKQQWRWPFASGIKAASSVPSMIFVRGSIRAWLIGRCWKASSRPAHLILRGGIVRSGSRASADPRSAADPKMFERLIKAGAFDFTGRDRAELFACIDESLNASAIAQRDRAAGQVSLFDEQTHAATA